MNKVYTLYFIHHSHTDIGFTHDPPIVLALQGRFLDEALRLADKYANLQSDGAFRWTVETTYVFYRWLQQASPAQIERFKVLEKAGRIEVTGMFANITPLFDTDQLIESFQLLRPLRKDYGFDITSAMNCDVNGENWPLVDILLELGIEGFTMAINTHFGGAPLTRPDVFWWEGPSGRKILAYNGWPYDTGWRFGIGRDKDDLEKTWWPLIEKRLEEINYPLPVLMVQSYHPFGDNGSAYEEFTHFIDAWNTEEKSPRIVMATPKMWWQAVKEYSHLVPTYRGDWTDYWNFGSISSAREEAINRTSRARLRSADAIAASTLSQPDTSKAERLAKSFRTYRESAWHSLNLWDEHTWGADCAIRYPGNEDTATQWHHKANFAYTARSLGLLLQRDALAELSHRVMRSKPDDLLIFNPLPWSRQVSGQVAPWIATPRGGPLDQTAARHFQDRVLHEDLMVDLLEALLGNPDKRLWLKPTEVPGYGYTVISKDDLVEWDPPQQYSEEATIENSFHRLTLDRERGGVVSWVDKRLDRELVDRSAGYPLNGYVHEQVADRSHPWPRNLMFHMAWQSEQVERDRGWKTGWRSERRPAQKVLSHHMYRTPLGCGVIQTLESPGCIGTLKQIVFLPDFTDYVDCISWWDMGLDSHPEATYLLFPFDIPGAQARIDLGGQAITAGVDQLPLVCRDYYTAQGWVDLSNDDFGITIALPENPMVQFGDFHFGHNQAEFTLHRAMLLGWVTNNYWETNFRAHQPGQVRAHYRLWPHKKGFDETRAHRFGLESSYSRPLIQHLGESTNGEPALTKSGSLLSLPEGQSTLSPILTLHLKPATGEPGLIVRLLNASDREEQAEVSSGLLHIHGAQVCDLLEEPLKNIEVRGGAVKVTIPPRRVITLRLNISF